VSDALHRVVIPSEVLKRGFWLYVWVITLRDGRVLHYVGPTGDASSARAQSPFSRISGHLGSNKNANALMRHLGTRGIEFEQCEQLEFVTHGPLHDETSDWEEHKPLRDKVHALERDLCDGMRSAGYDVVNTVSCKGVKVEQVWLPVRATFAARFERLRTT
jgi:hypothetical protein